MGPDLNLLTLRAQHWIYLEMTQPQQFIPYSSYEDSFWSYAYANIRAASGTSLASSNATMNPQNLSFVFLALVWCCIFIYTVPWLPLVFLPPTPRLAVLPVFQWIPICIIEFTGTCSNHLTYDGYATFFWNSCQACLHNKMRLEMMQFTLSGCWCGVVVLFHPLILCLCVYGRVFVTMCGLTIYVLFHSSKIHYYKHLKH